MCKGIIKCKERFSKFVLKLLLVKKSIAIHISKFRFYKFGGNLYYFNEDNRVYSWLEANAACTTMFPGQSGDLASFQTRAEFDFLV